MAEAKKRTRAEAIKDLMSDPYAVYLAGNNAEAIRLLMEDGRLEYGDPRRYIASIDKSRLHHREQREAAEAAFLSYYNKSAGKRVPSIFDELTQHNSDQLDALRQAQEENSRQTKDYVTAQLNQINQLNAGFTKQIEDMRASQAAEMAAVKQQNDATISGLNKSFQNELAMRDKQDAIRAQATNMAILKEKNKNKRGEFGSATLLSNPAAMGNLLLGKTSLLGL